MQKQSKNKNFKNILENINSLVNSGEPLSKALEKYPEVFSDMFVAFSHLVGLGVLAVPVVLVGRVVWLPLLFL